MSVVEHALREDPAGVYARMDFATRDRYRHAVEKIARKRGLVRSARWRSKAIALAQPHGAGRRRRDRSAHVGFYLVDKGLPQLGAARRTCGRPRRKHAPAGAARAAVVLSAGAIAAADAGLVRRRLAAARLRDGVATAGCWR